MGNLKTPIVRPLRNQGGTFFTFASAIEDIGLNVAERNNKVRLSHYAILNIPNCNELPGENDIDKNDITINRFNIYSSPGAMGDRFINDDGENNAQDKKSNQEINSMIAQSFMSYALNMETAVINSVNYDYSTSLTVSERVFWKWLKETGAIRWHRKNGKLYEGDTEDSSYNRVVKSIGKIDGVSQRSSDYGIYNEVYVNIPSSLGTMEPIIFKEIEDNNYSYNSGYVSDTDTLIGYSDVTRGEFLDKNSQIFNVGFYDYSLLADTARSYYITDNVNDSIWSDEYKSKYINNVYNNVYIVDKKPKDNECNNKISVNINVESQDNVKYNFLRSKYDCLVLDTLLESEEYDNKSYDDLCMNTDSSNYEFNTILVYYSIYDNENNVLATNLYGVYFIESSNNLDNDDNYTLKFEIPRLSKIKSNSDGFGTSYSFRLNMRTKSIYDDTELPIEDNSSSENSIVNDFNNVIANLNKSIELLGRHTKYTHILSNKYKDIENSIVNIHNDLIDVKNDINKILRNNNDEINASYINTDKLTLNDTFKIENNEDIKLILNDQDVINFDNSNINLNNNVNFDKSILYNTKVYDSNNGDVNINSQMLDNLLENIRIVSKSSRNDNIYDLLDIEIPNNLDIESERYLGLVNGKIDIITILAYILKKLQK